MQCEKKYEEKKCEIYLSNREKKYRRMSYENLKENEAMKYLKENRRREAKQWREEKICTKAEEKLHEEKAAARCLQ